MRCLFFASSYNKYTYIYIYLSIYLSIYLQFHVIIVLDCFEISEVLRVLEKQSSAVPDPFPQNAQYKNAIDDDQGDEDSAPTKKPKKGTKKGKKKISKGKRRGRAQVQKAAHVDEPATDSGHSGEIDTSDYRPGEVYTPTRYNFLRKKYVATKMESGFTWRKAQKCWNESDVKALLLSSLPLPELKRRRFVKKDCAVHPWAREQWTNRK